MLCYEINQNSQIEPKEKRTVQRADKMTHLKKIRPSPLTKTKPDIMPSLAAEKG